MWRALVLALCGLSACAEAMVVMQVGYTNRADGLGDRPEALPAIATPAVSAASTTPPLMPCAHVEAAQRRARWRLGRMSPSHRLCRHRFCRHRMSPHIRSAPVFKLQTGNFTLEFPSLPADFGKPIPPEGLTGLLLLAQPEDACSQLKPPRKSGAPWIALIARSQEKDGCTFDIKVRDVGSGGRCSRT
jgi:hypothetical protein